MFEKAVHILDGERLRAATTEHDRLFSRFIDNPIPVEASGNGVHGRVGVVCGDETRRGGGAKSSGPFNRVWRNHLEDAQSVFAIGDQSVHRRGHRTDLQ